MNGFDRAMVWLEKHGENWRIARADTRLEAGEVLGAPTTQRVYIELEHLSGVAVTGVGATHLEAVQRALGAWKEKER